MVITVSVMANALFNMSEEKARAQENVRQMQEVNSTLTLTAREFKNMLSTSEQRTMKHFDSLFKANKMVIKGVNEVHNITNTYIKKDSTIVMVPVTNVNFPLSIGDKCWGFNGFINNQQLVIKERYSHSEIDLVDYARPKRFLFIRVGWNPPVMKGFSDCGTITVRSYKRARDAL
jgi:hypothetical protein